MSISTIKSNLIKDIESIQTRNGYTIDIKGVYPIFMSYADINEYPSVAVNLVKGQNNKTPMGHSEIILTFGLIVYAQSDNDITKAGLLESELIKILDNISAKLLEPDSLINQSVAELAVGDYVIESEGNTGMLATTITTTHYQE